MSINSTCANHTAQSINVNASVLMMIGIIYYALYTLDRSINNLELRSPCQQTAAHKLTRADSMQKASDQKE